MEQMEGFFNHVADAILIAEPDGQIIDANPAATVLLGYSKEELRQMHPWDFVADASQQEILHTVQSLVAGEARPVQRLYRTRDGGQKVVSLRLTRNFFGGRDLIIGSCRDVTTQIQAGLDLETALADMRRSDLELRATIDDRKRAESLLAGEKRLLEMIARGDALLPVLDALCRLVEDVYQGSHCSILLLGPTGDRLWHGAAPSLPPSYSREFDGMAVTAESGPCGRAIYFRQPVDVPDITCDPGGRGEYAALALRHGLRSCWSTPIISSAGQPLGTFAIYLLEPGHLPPQQQELVQQTAHLASIAIERKQAAEALRASEHLARGQLEALRHTLDMLVQEPDPDRLLEHVLRAVATECRAHSVSVWERIEDETCLDLVAVLEDDRFQPRHQGAHPAARLPTLLQDHPVWQEVFRTGQHAVLEDLDLPCSRSRVGSAQDGVWQRVMDDEQSSLPVRLLKQHLRSLGVRCVLFVPMLTAGQATGIIGVRFTESRDFRSEEIELTRALAHQAMLALQLLRLSEQGRQTAVMEERNRMARDIHDTLAQGFTGIVVQLEAAADAKAQGLDEDQDHHLRLASQLARHSLIEARRSVHALRPSVLESRGLSDALDELFRTHTAGTAVRPRLTILGQARSLPMGWEENLVRISQEVLTNVLRHAHADTFEVGLRFEPQLLGLELRDNGRGFDPGTRSDGFGLLGMRERVESMGGQLTLESLPGHGTIISITLPLEENAESSPP